MSEREFGSVSYSVRSLKKAKKASEYLNLGLTLPFAESWEISNGINRFMKNPTDKEIAGQLVNIISDGFNRSLGALEQSGAIDLKKLQKHYKGVGSKFYDIVTEQIEYTARYGAPVMRRLFSDDKPSGG